MTVPGSRIHTNAVIAKLQAASLTVGDAQGLTPPPYVVVYPITGGSYSGTLTDPQKNAELVYQVTCVGSGREQAEWLLDKATVTMLSGITVTGRALIHLYVQEPSGVQVDNDADPPLFYATPRYRLLTVPS